MKRPHVAALAHTLRELSDPGAKGTAARTRIAVAALDGDEVKGNPGLAIDLLADELAPWSRDLLAEVNQLGGDDPDANAEGMLWLDLALVRLLERLDAGEGAGARAARAKADDANRWKLWTDTATPVGLVTFAGDLWSRRVVDRWRHGVDRPVAMVRAIAEPLNRLGYGAALDEASGEVRDGRGERIAGLNRRAEVATLDLEVMRRGFMAFRSTLAKRTIRYFGREARRAELRGDHRPEIVLVDGGLVGLAECIGADPGKDAGKLRDLFVAGRMLDLSVPGLEVHGLWHGTTIKRAAPGQRAVLEVALNRWVFLEGAAEKMKAMGGQTRPARAGRLLVPFGQDPPYRVTNRAEWGRVWSVADAVLVLLVDNGAELAREGGTRIATKAWARFAIEAGLDEGRASSVRDVLLEGDGISPPLLSAVGADRFTLGPEHAPELAFIVSRVDIGRRSR